MFFRIAAAIFVANDRESLAQSGDKIDNRVIHLYHEWTRIYTNKEQSQKFFINSCSLV